MTHIHKMNTKISSRINRSLVLSLIHENPLISRAQLSVLTGLDRSTITHILKYLLAEKFVRETEKGRASSRGGRRPISLEVQYDGRFLLAIEAGTENCDAVMVNLRGDEIRRWRRKIRRGEPLLDILRDIIHEIETTARKEFKNSIVIGISSPGIIDVEKGVVRFCDYHQWRDVDIVAPIGGKYRKVVFIENDANAAAVGELSQHAESNNRGLLYLLIRESPPESEQILGVGGAIIFNGNLWHGTNFFAGEVADTLNSLFLTGMIKKWRDKMSRTHEMKKRTLGYLLESAANNNPDSRAAADEIASHLGKFMGEVVAFLDPGCVMIYINPSHDGYNMAARIEEYFYKHIPAGFSTTRFLEPRLKGRAIIRGLISLTQEKIFVRDGIHSSLLFK